MAMVDRTNKVLGWNSRTSLRLNPMNKIKNWDYTITNRVTFFLGGIISTLNFTPRSSYQPIKPHGLLRTPKWTNRDHFSFQTEIDCFRLWQFPTGVSAPWRHLAEAIIQSQADDTNCVGVVLIQTILKYKGFSTANCNNWALVKWGNVFMSRFKKQNDFF